MAGFGDIWGAVEEGQNAGQQNINNYFHNQAMNAITGAYGPMLGDPQAALQAQQFNYLAKQDPQLVQEKALENTGLGLTNQLNSGALAPRVQAIQGQANSATAAGNVALGTQGGVVGATNAQNEGIAQTAVPAAQAGLSTAQSGAQTAQVGAGSALGYQAIRGETAMADAAQAALAGGAKPDDAFNAGLKAGGMAGLAPQQLQQYDAAHRAQFVADPQGAIDTVRSAATSAYNSQLAGLTPTQRIEMAKNNMDVEKMRGDMVGTAQKNFGDAREAELGILSKAGPVGGIVQSTESGQSALAQMRQMIQNGDVSASGLAREAGHYIPGSKMEQFDQLAHQVGSALSMDQVVGGREAAGGSLGLGKNLNEFKAAGDAVATFNDALNPTQLNQQISNADRQLKTLHDSAAANLSANNSDYTAASKRRQQLEGQLNSLTTALPGAGVGAPPAAPGAGAGAPPSSPAPPASGPPPAGGGAGDWRQAAASVGITPAQMATMSPSEIQQFTQFAASQRGGSAAPAVGNGQDALNATTANYSRDIPASGGGAAAPAGAAYVYQGLQARGFSPAQAAALAGNMQQESSFNPASYNQKEGAVGLVQWRGPRAAQLMQFAAQQGKPASDPDVQMDFLKREMDTTERGSAEPFMQAKTVEDANAALHHYIRYGDNTEPTRLAFAKAIAGGGAQQAAPAGGQQAAVAPAAPLLAQVANPAASAPAQGTSVLGEGQGAAPRPTPAQPAPTPAAAPARTASASTPSSPTPQIASNAAGVAAAAGEAATATSKLSKTPDKVMDGRALLAKYLGRPSGSV